MSDKQITRRRFVGSSLVGAAGIAGLGGRRMSASSNEEERRVVEHGMVT